MRARCVENDLQPLRNDPAFGEALANVYPRRDEPFELRVGAEYVVFAIAHQFGIDWYYLFEDPTETYPRWYPAALFEIVDAGRAPDWLTVTEPRADGLREGPRVWANTPDFYERLVNGDSDVLIAFRAVRLAIETADRRARGK